MRFLIDRCAGSLVARWLRSTGHDAIESRERGPDPGDQALLKWAANESRILITIDTDFGQLIFHEGFSHSGLIRLPDVRANERLQILEDILDRFSGELQKASIITVKGGRVRLSQGPKLGS